MPTGVILLIFFLVGSLLLIFREPFVEASSYLDWFFGPRFEESMKQFREVIVILVGGTFIVAPFIGFNQYMERKIGMVLLVFLDLVITLAFIYLMSVIRKKKS